MPGSSKADGTPKKRWSAADRAARGHTPRRSGGKPRTTARDGAARPARRVPGVPSDNERSYDRREDTRSADRPGSGRTPARSEVRQAPDRATGRRAPELADRGGRTDGGRTFDRRAPQQGAGRAYDRRDSGRAFVERDSGRAYAQRDSGRAFERGDSGRAFDRRDSGSTFAQRGDRSAPAADRSDRGRTDAGDRDDRTPNRYGDRPDRARTDKPAFRRDDAPTSRPDRKPFVSRTRPAAEPDFRPRSKPARFEQSRGDRPRYEESRSERPRYESSRDERPRDEAPRSEQSHADTEPRATVEPRPEVVRPSPSGTFADLGLPASLVSALRANDIVTPFAIQAATIPDALSGRDVLGRGQTGSGKTLAFGLPMIVQLAGANSTVPRAVVLVPTRELAMQVTDVLTPLGRTAGLSVTLVAGGMSYTPQLRAFERGVDIVVATPGRLIDLMDQGVVDLTRVEITVLDEADHMADLGFMPAVTTILDTVPAGGQRMLFSATLDHAVDRLVRTYLVEPVTHEVDSAQASVSTMVHHLVNVAPSAKALVTAAIAARPGRTVVFVRTQRGADRVAEELRQAGVLAGSLHGGLTQGARTRILSVFKDGSLPVLVATDVAARGIHVDDIGLVLQADPPDGPKEYLHRAGRTARAGGTGVVVTLVLPHQRRELTRLTGQAGVRATQLTGEPDSAELIAATGAEPTTRTAVTEAEFQRLVAPPAARRYGSGGGGLDRARNRGGRTFSRTRRG